MSICALGIAIGAYISLVLTHCMIYSDNFRVSNVTKLLSLIAFF